MVKVINDNDFKNEVLSASGVSVVDFWASWCGPCKMLAPVIEDLSGELEGKVKFLKLNVDENPVTSQQYGIASIPTLIVFKDGNAVDTLVGFRPKNAIKDAIVRHL